jgi:hypothetical protein
MRAKNGRRHRGIDTYVRAHRRAYAWAEKAIAYGHTGRVAQAKTAVVKARRWLRKIKLLGARAGAPRYPTKGSTP